MSKDVVLPAAIASRTMARPKVQDIEAELSKAGLIEDGLMLSHFDQVTEDLVGSFEGLLVQSEAEQVRPLLARARQAAACEWEALRDGLTPTSPGEIVGISHVRWIAEQEEDNERQQNAPSISGRSGDLLDTTRQHEPDEDGHTQDRPTMNTSHLQRELCLLIDLTKLRNLLASLHERQRWVDLRRLRELRDPWVSHSWLWNLDPEDGRVMPDMDYVHAVRDRLGANVATDDTLCNVCGEVMGPTASHAKCCAPSERTIGHYGVVRELVEGFKLADSTVHTEPRGLVQGSARRPADIYTKAALPGRDAALDITITSQEATGSGQDCCAAKYRDKMASYQTELHSLRDAGIGFRPLVFSGEGRPHPVVMRVLGFAADQAARRAPDVSAKSFVKRWMHNITVAIQIRKAKMLQKCLPKPSGKGAWLLGGSDRIFTDDDPPNNSDRPANHSSSPRQQPFQTPSAAAPETNLVGARGDG